MEYEEVRTQAEKAQQRVEAIEAKIQELHKMTVDFDEFSAKHKQVLDEYTVFCTKHQVILEQYNKLHIDRQGVRGKIKELLEERAKVDEQFVSYMQKKLNKKPRTEEEEEQPKAEPKTPTDPKDPKTPTDPKDPKTPKSHKKAPPPSSGESSEDELYSDSSWTFVGDKPKDGMFAEVAIIPSKFKEWQEEGKKLIDLDYHGFLEDAKEFKALLKVFKPHVKSGKRPNCTLCDDIVNVGETYMAYMSDDCTKHKFHVACAIISKIAHQSAKPGCCGPAMNKGKCALV